MAGVIAADDEWRSRKVLAPFDCQRAVTEEEPSAEALKHGATSGRRQEHAFRFARASHGSEGVASAFPDYAIKTNASVPTRLLKMPRVCQGDYDDANHDPVNDKYPQSVGLQVTNEPGDSGVTDNRRNDDANDKRRLHPGRQALLVNLVRLQQRGTRDE